MSSSIRKIINLILIIGVAIIFTSCSASEKNGTGDREVVDTAEAVVLDDEANDYSKENADKDQPDDAGHVRNKIAAVDLEYANQFSIDEYEDGYRHIHISNGTDYIVVPEGMEDDKLGYEDAVIIHRPVNSMYLASSAVMDLVNVLDSLDAISACSTKPEDYTIPGAVKYISNGDIRYVGKYSAPDYEELLNLGCDLAVENTMILHSPKIKEEIEGLGIPVMIEYSSYEEHPLARLEWIKLYGTIFDKEYEADKYFENEVKRVDDILKSLDKDDKNRPNVAFFYLSSNGYVNVRKPGDYISKMIDMAGGTYALDGLIVEEENALSTVNIGWEDFYSYARDADILIYNSTIDGGIFSVDDLLEKNQMFSDFYAVNNGKVWVMNKNVFQQTSALGKIIVELYNVLNEENADYEYFYKAE